MTRLGSDFLVEWRGFGTEEDDHYLSSLDFQIHGDMLYSPHPYFASNPAMDYTSLPYSNLDYQDMHADDAILDSYNLDFSHLNWDRPALSPEPIAKPETHAKKTWRDVVGTELEHPPVPPPPEPVQLETPEEETHKPKDKKKEVCRYWLNVIVLPRRKG